MNVLIFILPRIQNFRSNNKLSDQDKIGCYLVIIKGSNEYDMLSWLFYQIIEFDPEKIKKNLDT